MHVGCLFRRLCARVRKCMYARPMTHAGYSCIGCGGFNLIAGWGFLPPRDAIRGTREAW